MDDLQRLKTKGYRITKQRQELLTVLVDYPLTVAEISASLKKKKIEIDIASIYRSLELFKTMNIVSEIDLGEGKKRYELVNPDEHHHHLVCNSCGQIEDVDVGQEDELMKQIQVKSQFSIQNHSLELFGLCANCQS